LLRLARQPSNDVLISLGLREPMDLKATLEQMSGVEEVNLVSSPHPEGAEPLLEVQLLDTTPNPSNE